MPKPIFSYIVHVHGMLHCLLNPLAAAWMARVLQCDLCVGKHLPRVTLCRGEYGLCRKSSSLEI